VEPEKSFVELSKNIENRIGGTEEEINKLKEKVQFFEQRTVEWDKAKGERCFLCWDI
jgi:hypothetical protein